MVCTDEDRKGYPLLQLCCFLCTLPGAVAAGGVVSRGIHGNDEMTYRDYAGDFSYYDPELAKQYWDAGIAELGYTPEIVMLTAEGTDFDDMATFLQDCFRKVLGVEVTINTDDLLIFNSSIENEYRLLFNAGALSVNQLEEIRLRGLNGKRKNLR